MLPKRTRLKTFDYVGLYRYFLTFCTHQRQHLFTDDETVDDVYMQIRRAASECAFAIHAYVFMRDHLHLFVEGTDDAADLQRFVKLAKQYSGYQYSRENSKKRLWQPSYFEHTLRDEESTADVLTYIMNNPVRAGYATTWDEYGHMGSETMTMDGIAEVVRS